MLNVSVHHISAEHMPEGLQTHATGELYYAYFAGSLFEAYTLDLLKAKIRAAAPGLPVTFAPSTGALRRLPLNWE